MNPLLPKKMQLVLKKMGVNPEIFDYAMAREIIGEEMWRYSEGLCSINQSKILIKHGYPSEMSKSKANKIIKLLQKTGWK